jgi:hypothetical protein
MRILLKCPTRSRPSKVTETLKKYVNLASKKHMIGIAVSCDEDDISMTRGATQEEIRKILAPVEWQRIFFSPNKSKIEACNANMNEIDYVWDIVVLVSDDMIPQISGWDDVIRNHMKAYFPDTHGILWFNDGCQADKLNTLCVYGRKMYDFFGYIYEPSYKSLFCDTELTDRCRGDLAKYCRYVPYCVIRHEHPGTGFSQNMDSLYVKNQRYWIEDMYTYIQRKSYPYDWSVLIPTIPGREAGLTKLLDSIREKVTRICPAMRYEVCLAFDNKETSIGMKRQQLLKDARGKYSSFVDDDDDITDEYIEDLWACIQGGFHTMRLRGQMSEYTFVHSTAITMNSMMATKDEIPIFQRPPNHLNPMMADVAKFIPFKDAVQGEDIDWTFTLYKTGFLTKEYRSDPSRVHYIYNLGDRVVPPSVVTLQQNTSHEDMLSVVFTPSGKKASSQAPAFRMLRLGPKGFVSK